MIVPALCGMADAYMEHHLLNPPQAESLLREALRILEQSYGSENKQISDVLSRLGWIKITQRRAKEALPDLVRAVKIAEANYPADSWRVIRPKNLIAWALAMLGRSAESQKIMNTYMALFRRQYQDLWGEPPPEPPDFDLIRMFYINMEKAEKLDRQAELNKLGQKNSGKKACFVATVAYGDEDCIELDKLRAFRDNRLKEYSFGRVFTKFYYRYGHHASAYLVKRPFLRKLVKKILDFFVNFL